MNCEIVKFEFRIEFCSKNLSQDEIVLYCISISFCICNFIISLLISSHKLKKIFQIHLRLYHTFFTAGNRCLRLINKIYINEEIDLEFVKLLLL